MPGEMVLPSGELWNLCVRALGEAQTFMTVRSEWFTQTDGERRVELCMEKENFSALSFPSQYFIDTPFTH